MTTAVLEVRSLTAGYGEVAALRDISFSVEPGQISAVLGANGAGKTTLLKSLSGVIVPSAGTIDYLGESILGLAPEKLVRRGLVHVPEGRGIINELTVDENLKLSTLWRRDREEVKRDVGDVYERFEPLSRRRDQLGYQLSGGERQILAVARALLCRPKLLLLDEPSLGLAPLVVKQIMTLVRELVDQGGLSVLLVEQNARSALSVADHAVVLGVGEVVSDGPPAGISDDPAFRATYLGI